MLSTLTHHLRVRPMPGEAVGGDDALVLPMEDGLLAVIIDVLGHGPEAHSLTGTLRSLVEENLSDDPVELMTALHTGAQGTRGAAVGICLLKETTGEIHYTGIGNTSLRIFGERSARLISREGIVGQVMRSPYEEKVTLRSGDVVLMHTDGIRERFEQDDYPQITRSSPEEITETVIKRFGRAHDDAGCIAIRWTS